MAKRTEGVSLTDEEVESKVEDRIPYIVSSPERDSSGVAKISGWENISAVAEKKEEPGDIYVEMNGGSLVPGDVLGKISGRNITFHFIMDDTYIWAVNGRSFTATPQSTDLRVGSSTRIPSQAINELAGVYPHETFSIEHKGDFTFSPTLDIDMGQENAGKKAHLYSYNENEYKLELLGSDEISDLGYASFPIPYSSDYLVIVGTDTYEETTTEVIEPTTGEESNAGDFANTKKSSSKLWIIVVSIIAVLLIAVIIFLSGSGKNRNGNTDETDNWDDRDDREES